MCRNADVVGFQFFFLVFTRDTDSLVAYGIEVGVAQFSYCSLEHGFHGSQHSRGVYTVLFYFLEVLLHHLQYVETVLIVVFTHVALFVLYVFGKVRGQSRGKLGEIVDVVDGVEYTVDESLCQFAGSGCTLHMNQFCLCFLQVAQSVGQF